MTRKQKKVLARIIVSATILAASFFVPDIFYLPTAVLTVAYLTVGYDILIKAFSGIVALRPFDENFLMALASVGAFFISEPLEAVAVMWLYQVGELFQSVAVGKSRRSIAELMDIRPDYANLETEEGTVTVDPDEVPVGAVTVVLPGEKIPIDGRIIEGRSSLNTSALTGESLPRDVETGEEVSGGCINISGALRIRTTRPFGESTAARILDLIENASSKKSKSEQFISRFARIYTPVVCLAALLLATVPPLILFALGNPLSFSDWIYRALTFLVISCPCALVISVPLTFFAGLGRASGEGILIKGSNYIETVANIGSVAFDKTGTVTEGVFEVTGIYHSSDPERMLYLAAHAEIYSKHPISTGLLNAFEKNTGHLPRPERVSDAQDLPGRGITATVDGVSVAVGNVRLMKELGITYRECEHVGTALHVAANGSYMGYIVIADKPKWEARWAVKALRRIGIGNIVILTGDRGDVAEEVGRYLTVNRVYPELLPSGKVGIVESMLSELSGSGKTLAFVGDGINDAPVLTRADVGISMGALGSDAAIEASDVVIMDDDVRKVVTAIEISRKVVSIVRQNIAFALTVKFICLGLGAFGIANMWIAIFADVGTMVIAVLNSLRAMVGKDLL